MHKAQMIKLCNNEGLYVRFQMMAGSFLGMGPFKFASGSPW